MNQDTERDFLALNEQDIFEEARDRLKIASDAEAQDRSQAREDLRFREGDQWDNDVVTTATMEEPELVINLTDAMVRRVVNNIKQQRPRGKCHPVGNGAQLEIADVINGIGRHIECRSEASIAYDNGAEMAVAAGWGYWRMLTEYAAPDSFEQEILIRPIHNVFSVYMDPGSVMPTGQDANWVLICTKMKRTEYKRLYPNEDNAEWNEAGRDDFRQDWEDKEEIRLAEYFRVREKADKLYLLRDSTGNEFTRFADQMPQPESLAQLQISVVMERKSSRRMVEWFRLNGTKVVDRRQLPGQWIPVIRCQGNSVNIDGKVCRRGMVRSMRDPQRMVNYGEVAKIKRLGLTPKAPWVGAEGQFDGHPEWDDANRTPYSKLVYKPVTVTTDQGEQVLPPPQRQPPAQIEQGFSEFVQGMRTNLLAVANMPNEPGADKSGEVVSGKALAKRQYLSDQGHFQYYDNQTLAIAQTWRIMLDWIPHYYSEERMQRIIGEDSMPKMVQINATEEKDGVKHVKNDLSVGRYDVVMDTGPGYETKREEGADTLLDLLKAPYLGEVVAKTGADLIFRSLDHPYMQELADRLASMNPDGLKQLVEGLPERAKAVVTQLANQNQQLKQQLQQLQLELKYGLAKEQMKAETKVHDTTVSAQTKMADTQEWIKAELGKEEIKAGAALLGKHVDNAHAMRLIEKGEQSDKANGSTGQQ
jgi:hypothetical protein